MPVVLVFAKEPRPGRAKTRLADDLGPGPACDLYRAFLADLARNLSRLPPEVEAEWWLEGDPEALRAEAGPGVSLRAQPEGDLGCRLQTAFASAFARHRGPVAAVGSDCPLLGPEHIEGLWRALGKGADAAVIPAEDGGYAAIALAAPVPEAFEGIPWSTEGVLEATLSRFARAGRKVALLPPLADVDRAGDLRALADALAAAPERAPATARTLARLLGAGAGPNPGRTLVDALGRTVALEPVPRRIVSLVPSVTECLFDLGAEDRVVGRTEFCISPAGRVEALPSVGGPKTVDVAAAAALAPDLVLANIEENDREQVEALAALGVRVHVSFPRALEDAARFLEAVGSLVRAQETAARCAADLRAAAGLVPRPSVRTACLIWKGPYLTASADTLTSAILTAAGAENVFAGRPGRYPEVSAGDLAAARPRVVLLPSEPYGFGDADARQVEKAVPGAAAVLCPGEWVTWYGCRMPDALAGLRRLLAPYRDGTVL
jgi:rSAM/selenodomain-associated transferase 1